MYVHYAMEAIKSDEMQEIIRKVEHDPEMFPKFLAWLDSEPRIRQQYKFLNIEELPNRVVIVSPNENYKEVIKKLKAAWQEAKKKGKEAEKAFATSPLFALKK